MEVSFKIPRFAPNKVLFVSLAFFKPELETLLKGRTQNALNAYNQQLEHDVKLVFALSDLTLRQKYLEEERVEGSFKELFFLASSARTLGWRTVVVADAITLKEVDEQRELEGGKRLDVVLIDTKLGHQKTPIARRMTLEEAFSQPSGFDLQPPAHGFDATKLVYNGFPLHDPDSPLWSTTASSVGVPLVLKQLIVQKRLPLEVISKITEQLAVQEVAEDLKGLVNYTDLSGGDLKDKVLEIQVSERNTDLQQIKRELEAEMTENTKASLALFDYMGTGVLTRRKVRQIFSGVCWVGDMSFPVYDPKLWQKEHRLISIGWSSLNNIPLAHKVTMEDLIQKWHTETKTYRKHGTSMTPEKYNRPFYGSDSDVEFLAGPTRFFFDPPSWTTYGQGQSPHKLVCLSRDIPAETLTNAAREVFYAYYNIIDTRTRGTDGMLVPWPRKRDADLRDVYEIWLSAMLTSWHWRVSARINPMFLDSESRHDGHCIVVSSVHSLYTRSGRPVFYELRFKRVLLQCGRLPFALAIHANEYSTPLTDVLDPLSETTYAGRSPPPMTIYDPRHDVSYDWDWTARAWRVPHKYIPRQDPSPFLYDPHTLTMDNINA